MLPAAGLGRREEGAVSEPEGKRWGQSLSSSSHAARDSAQCSAAADWETAWLPPAQAQFLGTVAKEAGAPSPPSMLRIRSCPQELSLGGVGSN